MTTPAGHRGRPSQQQAEITDLLRRICQTPAPTFAEAERGRLLAGLWKEAGLEPDIDAAGNVVAEVAGGTGPRVLVAAHMDTVFPAGTDVRVREQGERLAAPGIGDNSASLAVLTHFLSSGASDLPRLSVAATTGEEGLGNLAGIRHLMAGRSAGFDLVVALDGHLGTIVERAVGSRRLEVQVSAPGGHSWGDFPGPSAVHAVGDAIHALNGMNVPGEPRSSYNVGQVWGGTSINAIAQEAGFNLDLRSLELGVLDALERESRDLISRVATSHGVAIRIRGVGDRPTADVANRHLVEAAAKVLDDLGVPVRRTASSTDANASMAAGLPSIGFGVYRGGDAHRLSEWIDPGSLVTGYQALAALMAALSRLAVGTSDTAAAS